MVFDRWHSESLYAARLTEVVYYLSAGFLLLPACEPEHVPTQRGSLLPAQDSCGIGTSRFRNSGSHDHTVRNGHRLAAYGDFSPVDGAITTDPAIVGELGCPTNNM